MYLVSLLHDMPYPSWASDEPCGGRGTFINTVHRFREYRGADGSSYLVTLMNIKFTKIHIICTNGGPLINAVDRIHAASFNAKCFWSRALVRPPTPFWNALGGSFMTDYMMYLFWQFLNEQVTFLILIVSIFLGPMNPVENCGLVYRVEQKKWR